MIDFPATPVAGQIFFASNGAVYQYNSTYTAWVQIASSVLQDASFCAAGTGSVFAPSVVSTWETANPGVTVGNVGGWYNATTGVFTPPAGRYYLWGQIQYYSSSASMYGELRWRKNGVVIPNNTMTSFTGTNQNMVCCNAVMVDANGTDTFDLQVQSSVLMSVCTGTMGAFPLSQAASIPGGGSSWRQIARTVVGVATPTIDFQNIPSDINDLELRFDLTPVTDAVDLILRWYDAGGVLLSASYGYVLTRQLNTQALGAAPSIANNGTAGGITTGVMLNYAAATSRLDNVSGGRGSVKMNNIRDAARPKSVDFQLSYLVDDASALASIVGSGWRATAGGATGLQLALSSGNFAVGSTATLYGSP